MVFLIDGRAQIGQDFRRALTNLIGSNPEMVIVFSG
jgi:hypothetical protein